MEFQVSARLHYQVLKRSTVLLNIHALASANQHLENEWLKITPGVEWGFLSAGPGENRYVRLDTGNAPTLEIAYSATATTRVTMVKHSEIENLPISQLLHSAVPYLFPSRYCQSDRLGRLAAQLFGHYTNSYDRVVAIADWIFENIDYLSGSTTETTSAFDTVTQRAGVCRDFAHLGIALCRAVSIPARYFTGYACRMQPPDFHACFEACIGNRWFVFDPARLAPLNGLVRISTGRDAADTSFATTFGEMALTSMEVSCTSADFQALGPGDLAEQAILIEP